MWEKIESNVPVCPLSKKLSTTVCWGWMLQEKKATNFWFQFKKIIIKQAISILEIISICAYTKKRLFFEF